VVTKPVCTLELRGKKGKQKHHRRGASASKGGDLASSREGTKKAATRDHKPGEARRTGPRRRRKAINSKAPGIERRGRGLSI